MNFTVPTAILTVSVWVLACQSAVDDHPTVGARAVAEAPLVGVSSAEQVSLTPESINLASWQHHVRVTIDVRRKWTIDGSMFAPAQDDEAPAPSEPPATTEPPAEEVYEACAQAECGADHLVSESCGECADAACVAGACHAACTPPAVSTGKTVGDVLPSMTLRTCEGDDFHTDALCGKPASLLLSHCGWCPLSSSYLAQLPGIAEQFEPSGFTPVLVVHSNPSGGPPTSAYCKQIREQAGPRVQVVYDPTGEFAAKVSGAQPGYGVVVDGRSAEHVISSIGDQASFQQWLIPHLVELLGEPVTEATSEPVSVPEEALLSVCYDFATFALWRVSSKVPGGKVTPAVTSVVGDFCECLAAGDAEGFLDALLGDQPLWQLMDGLDALMGALAAPKDFAKVYEHVHECIPQLDREALETLAFEEDFQPSCTDGFGGMKGAGLPPQLFAWMTFRVKPSYFWNKAPVPALKDECIGSIARLSYCDGDLMMVDEQTCASGCAQGQCLPE